MTRRLIIAGALALPLSILAIGPAAATYSPPGWSISTADADEVGIGVFIDPPQAGSDHTSTGLGVVAVVALSAICGSIVVLSVRRSRKK